MRACSIWQDTRMQILFLWRLDFLLCVNVTPGVILEGKTTPARICIQFRFFLIPPRPPLPGWTCINFHCHFPVYVTKKRDPKTSNIRGIRDLYRRQVTAEHLVWSSGRAQEHTHNPGWRGGVKDPGRRCRGTVGPAHRMKWANTQSSRSECGSGVA